jgi:hypothetical protein
MSARNLTGFSGRDLSQSLRTDHLAVKKQVFGFCGELWWVVVFRGLLRFAGVFLLAFGGRKCDFLIAKTWIKRGESCGFCGHYGGGFGRVFDYEALEKLLRSAVRDVNGSDRNDGSL